MPVSQSERPRGTLVQPLVHVSNHVHATWVNKVHFFKGCNAMFIAKIALVMEIQTFAPRESIINYLDPADKMFIVYSGMALVKDRVVSAANPVFGDDVILSYHNRKFTARSIHYADIFVL